MTLFIELCLAVLCAYMLKSLLSPSKSPLPLPPGPKPNTFLGNLADLPPPGEQEWVHWAKHRELYGPISSITTFGQTLVIINDQDVVFELLDKRSATYSSRPRMVFSGELVGWQNTLVAQPYSDRFRAYRKNLHAELGSKTAASRFNPLQETEVHRFLLRVFEDSEKLYQHIQTLIGAVLLKISHGYTIEPRDGDPLVELADQALATISHAGAAGGWTVDMIPFLRYFPAWIPGMGFKRTAEKWRRVLKESAEKPYTFVKRQMAAGTHVPSYTSTLLEKGDLSLEEEFIVKWSAQSLYAGGSETTVTVLKCFFLAMMVHPEVQRKAQEEIDIIIGSDCLPGFKDRKNLPYIDAIVKEVLRWHPVGPLGFPHMSTADDTYEGYYIPKGSILIPNVWLFTHDPKTYHDPMRFKPERFLSDDDRQAEMDPRFLAFGFGRRICPGREIADALLYLTIAQSLAVFNIKRPIYGGNTVVPAVAFTPGPLSQPLTFKAEFEPRSRIAEALIRSVEIDHPFIEGDSKAL